MECQLHKFNLPASPAATQEAVPWFLSHTAKKSASSDKFWESSEGSAGPRGFALTLSIAALLLLNLPGEGHAWRLSVPYLQCWRTEMFWISDTGIFHTHNETSWGKNSTLSIKFLYAPIYLRYTELGIFHIHNEPSWGRTQI